MEYYNVNKKTKFMERFDIILRFCFKSIFKRGTEIEHITGCEVQCVLNGCWEV